MLFEGLPLVIAWELTLACNLRCRHCGSSAGMPRARELSLDEALAVCDQFPDLLVQEVDFTGGEPLVRPDWPRIAARLAELGIKTQIITNGLALDPDTLAQIKDVGVASVGFSLDGLETTHDHIRGYDGLFRRVLTGMERVRAAGLRVPVLTTVNALNLHELPALLALLQSIGIDHWQIQPIFPIGRAAGAREINLSQPAYSELGDFAREWVPKAKQAGFTIDLADSLGYFSMVDDVREITWLGCPAGVVACGITSDGMVKGCLSLPDALAEGDVRQNSLWDIWFQSSAFAYNRQFAVADLGPNCRGCEMGEQCKGGCSAMSYGSTGCFHNDPYCFYGMQQSRWSAEASQPRSLGAQ